MRMHTYIHTHSGKTNKHTPSHLLTYLGDEVRREVLLEALLVLEGVVQLGVGHGARLEPAVKHLVHTPQRRVARPLGGDGDVVHRLAVEVGDALCVLGCVCVCFEWWGCPGRFEGMVMPCVGVFGCVCVVWCVQPALHTHTL